MTTPLYKFQEEGVARIEELGGNALLADEMGLGKTIQALTYLKNHPELRPAVIVCPASIKGGWERQASEHLNLRVELLSTRRPPKARLFYGPTVFCINYDILKDWLPWLLRAGPKIIIADECHYVTSIRAQRTRALQELVRATGKLLAISGTPLTNRPGELWPVLNMISPKLWPNHLRFLLNYTNRRMTPWGWDYSRPKNLGKLHRKMVRTCMIRRLKQDVLADLPEKTRNVVPIVLSDRKEYDEAERDFRSWLIRSLGGAAFRSLRAEAVVKVGHLKRLAAKLKLRHMIGWVENFLEQSDGKIILFAVHRSIIAEVKNTFRRCAVVTGDVTGGRRDAEFRRFNEDGRCRVFVGNIQAAGVGWSASACSDVAFLELPWTPGAVEQAIDRTHGIGRGRAGTHTTAHFLLAANTVEERICRLLDRKQKTLDLALDGRRGNDKADLLDALMDEMSGEAA